MAARRIDIVLVELGHFSTREKAQRAIMAGCVYLGTELVTKPSRTIRPAEDPLIRVRMKDHAVSRAYYKLQKALEKEGAKVIMTRYSEQFFDNKERILFYRDSLPDLLLSIHLNSSEDPFRAGGTGTFYRYIGFRNLSLDIYKRLLELGLKEYGNTGSFNFMLNSPIEYPNALIETLFLSNLEEEEKILDPVFQQQMVDKIVLGVKDFLEGCKKQ